MKNKNITPAKVFSIQNEKGGTSKSTTATTLAYLLAKRGEKVALIDFDGQGHASMLCGAKNLNQLEVTISTLLNKVIQEEPLPDPETYIFRGTNGVDLIPSNSNLFTFERNLANVLFREYVLYEYVKTINQGNNLTSVAGQAKGAQTTVNNGKNTVTPANQVKNTPASVNNDGARLPGKNTVTPANQVKNAPASANNGKNAAVNAQTTVNQGKNTKAQRIADSLKTGNRLTSVNNGKNALPVNTGKKPQSAVINGKNLPQTPHPVKMPQPAVINSKNDVKPVDIKADKIPDAPEVVNDSEVKSDV